MVIRDRGISKSTDCSKKVSLPVVMFSMINLSVFLNIILMNIFTIPVFTHQFYTFSIYVPNSFF